MYCVKCGVRLEDTEKKCPLCGTVPFHPEIEREEAERLYPENKFPKPQSRNKALQILITMLCVDALIITLLCDWQINAKITWSGFVAGALTVAYVCGILPMWFQRPNPVIFVPCGFISAGLYVAYINYALGGDWFLSFAFPLIGSVGIILTAVVTLTRYLKSGKLYIFGGAATLLGILMPVLELLVNITFHKAKFVFWSVYPLAALFLLGGKLIFLANCRPAREAMERKFFL